MRAWNPTGIVLSGGPNSVYDEGAPGAPRELLDVAPVLGVCYGMNLVAHLTGGTIEPAHRREYGRAEIEVVESRGIFEGSNAGERTVVWMSHGDQVTALPDGFEVLARTSSSPGGKPGAPSSYTELGPPLRMIPVGFQSRTHSTSCARAGGWISEYTRASRTRRAMSWVNCEP